MSRRKPFDLTPAEMVVLVELCRDGAGNDEIARRLGIQGKTVKSHLLRIFEKLECHNRASVMIAVLRDQKLRAVCFPWLTTAFAQGAVLEAFAAALHGLIDEEVTRRSSDASQIETADHSG